MATPEAGFSETDASVFWYLEAVGKSASYIIANSLGLEIEPAVRSLDGLMDAEILRRTRRFRWYEVNPANVQTSYASLVPVTGSQRLLGALELHRPRHSEPLRRIISIELSSRFMDYDWLRTSKALSE